MKPKRVLPLLLVFLGVAAYFAVFYGARSPSLENEKVPVFRRVNFLTFLLLPDQLVTEWFGDPAELSLGDRLPVLGIASLILASAGLLGWLLMGLCRADQGLTRLEILVFSMAVGLNAVSTYVLLVGLLGLLGNLLVFVVPTVITLGAAALRLRRGMGQSQRDPDQPQPGHLDSARPRARRRSPDLAATADGDARRRSPDLAATADGDDWLNPRWLWLAAPFVLIILLGGMLPPIEFDVREYHLQAPKEFFEAGRIDFLPHNLYGNVALGTEMLSLLAMVLADDWWLGALAGKTVIAAFAPLTALGLFSAGRRFFSPTAGVVAAVVYLSIPWVVQVSTIGFVEGASALYLLLACYAVLLHEKGDILLFCRPPARRGQARTEEMGSSPFERPWLLLAGYLAGAAVSCKYPNALFVVIPLAAWILFVQLCKKGARNRFAPKRFLAPFLWTAVFLLAAVAGCGLWFAKNWVLAGNPIYPMMYEIFGGKTWTPEKSQLWSQVVRPHDFSLAALGTDMVRVVLRSEWLSPLLMPLGALAFLRRDSRRPAIVLAAYFGFVIAAWWLFALRIDRYWVPALPLAALLAGAGACWSRERPWRWALMGLLLFGSMANFVTATSRPVVGDNRYFVSLKRLRDDPRRVDPWHRYFNKHVTRGRVLLVGEAQVFDLEVPILYNTWLDDSIFEQLAKDPFSNELRPSEEIRSSFRARGISHVYVHWGEIRRYRKSGYGSFDFIQPQVFETLFDQGVLEPIPLPLDAKGHAGRAYRVLRCRGE